LSAPFDLNIKYSVFYISCTELIVPASDFCKYYAYRAHREWKVLRPLPAVHQSAEVQRIHPTEPMIC
jgi:hypothetical protein